MKRRKQKLPTVLVPVRALPHELWQTKEGFFVQIRNMTDMHLLNTFMMLMNNARQTVQLAELSLFATAKDSSRANLDAMVRELRFRRLIDRLPESF